MNEIYKLSLNDSWAYREDCNDVIGCGYSKYKGNTENYKLIMLQRNLPLKQKYWEIVMYILKEKV